MNYLIVFLGAGVGGAMRHGVNLAANRISSDAFPLGTLFVNVVGSFIMGIIIEYLALRGAAPQHLRLFLTTGVLGGFTTFSAFSLDTALLFERGQPETAALYAMASVALSIAALFLGIFIIRGLSQALQ